MKNKIPTILFIVIWCNFSVDTQGLEIESIPVAWLDSREIYVVEEKFFIHTNMGSVPLKIVEYDKEGERYLVECIKHEGNYYPEPKNFLEL